MTGFSITQGRGFHITFANGYTFSVQFGQYNHCENQRYGLGNKRPDGDVTCPNAEIAAWDEKDWHRFEGASDDVIGWVTPDQVLEYMNLVAKLEKRT